MKDKLVSGFDSFEKSNSSQTKSSRNTTNNKELEEAFSKDGIPISPVLHTCNSFQSPEVNFENLNSDYDASTTILSFQSPDLIYSSTPLKKQSVGPLSSEYYLSANIGLRLQDKFRKLKFEFESENFDENENGDFKIPPRVSEPWNIKGAKPARIIDRENCCSIEYESKSNQKIKCCCSLM
ncbi:unnamed protein product [Blepharisma stoltei]|uniref:Uncharacterized protein n=1 Tax=Blepharisma stoltei TaxID=1481888 RepID=A0AAU9JB28_9CILI|nr:unnamed protein product [Blepharisma stoltei]